MFGNICKLIDCVAATNILKEIPKKNDNDLIKKDVAYESKKKKSKQKGAT
jgi:hypothetical protein